jgi:hypothetical protein
MRNLLVSEFVGLFCLRRLVVLGGGGVSILATVGLLQAAVGFGIGVGLFVFNSYFLYETGRALIKRDSKGRGGAIAGISSLGRILFLAMVLAVVSRQGQVVLFATFGGLVLGQTNLHLSYMIKRKAARCSNN